jgi:plastocyanin
LLLLTALLAACSGSEGGDQLAASPLLGRDESWSYTFAEPGTYQIRCRPHPQMRQTVHVVAPGGDAPGERTTAAAMEDLKFQPGELRVEAGQTVTWTNHDGADHNVSIRRVQEGGS